MQLGKLTGVQCCFKINVSVFVFSFYGEKLLKIS